MSGAGAPTSQPFDASDLKVAVVAASWHTQVMDGLVAGAERALAAYGIGEPEARAYFASWAGEDYYPPLCEELQVLRAAGFAEPECFWRDAAAVVFGAVR